MIESKNYFVTYVHYLECLKKLDPEHLPFEK